MLRLLPFRLLLRPRDRAEDHAPTDSSQGPSRQMRRSRSRKPRRRYRRSNPVHSFKKLPAELLNHIFEYLQRDDLACLALTCHRMQHLIGPTYWTLKNNSNQENLRFLSRFVRDRIGWHICPRCTRLHASFSIAASSRQSFWKTWTPNPKLTCMEHTPLKDFDFARLHSIMKDYRATGSTSLLDDIRTTWRYDKTSDRRVPHKELSSVEGKIIDDELYLRTQQWLFVDTKSDLRTCNKGYSYMRWTPKLGVCSHRSPYEPVFLWKFWQCYPNLLRIRRSLDRPDLLESLHFCKCGVAEHMMTFPTSKGGRASVVTRWMRLGSGLFLCPKDELWHTAMRGKGPGHSDQRDVYFPYVLPDVPRVQQAYEADERVSWSRLTKNNRSPLEKDHSARKVIFSATA